jgi:hypothetical protein
MRTQDYRYYPLPKSIKNKVSFCQICWSFVFSTMQMYWVWQLLYLIFTLTLAVLGQRTGCRLDRELVVGEYVLRPTLVAKRLTQAFVLITKHLNNS